MQDNQGNFAKTTSNVTINLISTDVSIGQINQTLTIGPQSQFQTYTVATFDSTYKAGSTNIVAAATDWNSNSQSISTIEYIPPKLAVFVVPSSLPSDNALYNAIIVQLQDSKGHPTQNLGGDVIVNLSSQHPEVANVISTLTIPAGKTQATGNLTVSNTPGTTAITAASSGYTAGQATATTYLIDYSPLQALFAASSLGISSGSNVEITTYVLSGNTTIPGAIITFSSNNGGTFSITNDQGNGYYKTNFTAPAVSQATNCIITASATKTGYITSTGTIIVTVNANPSSTATATPSPTPATSPTPTPTPTSTSTSNKNGTIQLCIKDVNNNPLKDTVVSSTVQPSGMGTLIDVTNSSGYVTFENPAVGSYVFSINKVGYPQTNATIEFTGEPLALTITLTNNTVKGNNTNLIILLVIIIVTIAITAVATLLWIKRNNLAKVRKIQKLQNQLK